MLARKSLGAGVALLLLAASGCFNQPNIDAGSLKCKSDENCPSGYACFGAIAGVVGTCVRPGADGAVEDVPGTSVLPEVGSDMPFVANDSIAGATGTGGIASKGGATGTGGMTTTSGIGGTSGTGGTSSTSGTSDTGPAQCPTLTNPSNGSVSVPSTTVASIATYTCSSGYQAPVPAKERTCQSDGTWNGVVPTCNPVDCGAPPTVTNASVSRTATTYGSSATYACDTGYAMSGTSALTCQADSTWTRPGPACTIVDCGSPPKIASGSVSAARTTYQSTATYTCDVGNVLSGATTTRTCQADGTWSTPVPACTTQMLTLKISETGPGAGGVTSSNGGISCGATCTATYAYGTTVTLTATPSTNQAFVGWSGAGCTGRGQCSFIITSDTTVSATFSPAPNIVFVTSTKHDAALGGLAGADDICKGRAQAAGLPGTYRAWLSTSTVNAKDRLGSASGWVRTDGKPVLNRVEDIASNRFFYPPRLDESGKDVGSVYVRTNTSGDGAWSTETTNTSCGDFTLAPADSVELLLSGLSSGSGEVFTRLGLQTCSTEQPLYCFGVDRAAIVGVDPVATGRYAFIANPWSSGGGIASADARCQTEASDAHLPGTYKALLAANGASAASRFNTNGAPWVRLDGIQLAPTASAFFSSSLLDAAPNVAPDGQYFGNFSTWSGAATMTIAGTSETTCSNWQSVTSTSLFGIAGDTSSLWFFGVDKGLCSQSGALICLQE